MPKKKIFTQSYLKLKIGKKCSYFGGNEFYWNSATFNIGVVYLDFKSIAKYNDILSNIKNELIENITGSITKDTYRIELSDFECAGTVNYGLPFTLVLHFKTHKIENITDNSGSLDLNRTDNK